MKSLGQWLFALGLALALSGAYLGWRHLRAPAPALPPSGELAAATLINDQVPLPAFTLHRLGGPLANADLAGRWTLLDFGYTYCPDICPTTLATLKDLKERLVAGGSGVPQVIFVSVDPARDTPERMASFVQFFDPSFVGATGDDAALAPLVKHLGVYFQRLDSKDKEHYTVDHSAAIYLIDPQGRLKAVFSWPHDPARMAADYPKIIAPGG
jgi:protein SCO1